MAASAREFYHASVDSIYDTWIHLTSSERDKGNEATRRDNSAGTDALRGRHTRANRPTLGGEVAAGTAIEGTDTAGNAAAMEADTTSVRSSIASRRASENISEKSLRAKRITERFRKAGKDRFFDKDDVSRTFTVGTWNIQSPLLAFNSLEFIPFPGSLTEENMRNYDEILELVRSKVRPPRAPRRRRRDRRRRRRARPTEKG